MQTESVMDTSVAAGSNKYLSAPFKTKVAMYVGSTAGESFVA